MPPLYADLPGQDSATADDLSGGAAGDLPYQAGANTTDFLAAGNDGDILEISSGIPTWTAGPANLAGGVAGDLPYQSAPNVTDFLSVGNDGDVLTVTGSTPAWTAPTGGQTIGFSAYQTIATALGSAVFTPIIFNAELFDIGNFYDTVTGRFTPNVEGYYQINAQVRAAIAANAAFAADIFVNGAEYKQGSLKEVAANVSGSHVSGLVYLNGTTDYVEIHVYSGLAGNTDASVSAYCYFDGFLAFAA